MNRNLSKAELQRVHAKKRFKERRGLDFNRHVRREFTDAVISHTARCVLKQSNRVSVYDIVHEGRTYRCAFDHHTRNIITVLPEIDGVPVDPRETSNTRDAGDKNFMEFEERFDRIVGVKS